MRLRRLPSAVAPSSPNQSAEVRLLLALVEAVAHDRFPEQFKSAILREEARLAGELAGTDKYLPPDVHPSVRALMAQPGAVEAILGHVAEDGSWVFGKASLTPQESRAWSLFSVGFKEREIAKFMDGATRRTKQFGISVEAVYKHLQRGRLKLEEFLLHGEVAA